MRNRTTGTPKALAIVVLTMITLLALPRRDAAGFSATPVEKQNFADLLAVKWLTCSFGPVETADGEVLEGIRFDAEEKRTRVTTAPADKAEMGGALKESDSPFSAAVTLVFDAAKNRARLLPPDPAEPEPKFRMAVSSLSIQRVSWLNPGALHVVLAMSESPENSFVTNLVVFPAKTADDAFAGMASLFFDLGMIVMSARCAEEIDETKRDEAEKIRNELETAGNP